MIKPCLAEMTCLGKNSYGNLVQLGYVSAETKVFRFCPSLTNICHVKTSLGGEKSEKCKH